MSQSGETICHPGIIEKVDDQMVYVKMKSGNGLPAMGRPFWVKGTFSIDPVDSPYGKVGFSLEGDEGALFESWQQFD